MEDDADSNVSGLILTGGGTLLLSGSNTYEGGTYVDAGTLIASNATAIPAGGSLAIGAGGTFIFDPTATAAPLGGSALAASAVAAVPEPGTLALVAAAMVAGLGIWRRRKELSA